MNGTPAMRVMSAIIAPALLVFSGCHGSMNTNQARRHEAARVLASGRLRVEVMDPVSPDRYNRGNRFSPVANVLRATLDGTDFLFSPVAHDPLNDNAGLAMEFDLFEWPEGGPPGFSEAKEGESFVKVGVGLLKKQGDEYGFYKPYETVALAPTTVTWGSDCAKFRQSCRSPGGYAYVLEAAVRVHDHSLEIEYRLRNTGEKSFATEQYAHNFFSLGGMSIGPDYEIEMPGAFTMEETGMKVLKAHGRNVGFLRDIPAKKASNATLMLAPTTPAAEETITVSHLVKGWAIKARVSLPTSHVAIHAEPGYLSPEQFVRIRLKPGESASWIRSYEFLTDTPAQARSARTP